MRSRQTTRGRHPRAILSALLAAGWITLSLAMASAAEPAPKITRAGPIKPSDWQNASTEPIQSAELDRLVGREMLANGGRPAPRTTDEQFVRRVTLDLTGKLPLPADVTEFIADKASNKRARLIDRLLDSDDYATHWARYWGDVMGARLTDFRSRLLRRSFEQWMTEQLKSNRGWDKITRDILTASGAARFDDNGKTGNAFFLASHFGADAAVEQAAETSRIFLGIQINCAQCHDHPFDKWKREQFHELTAFFARVRSRPMRDTGNPRLVGVQLVSARIGEHRMPKKDDPRERIAVNPRFLDGKAPGRALGDRERRRSLADSVVSKGNPWFAAAFVNRMWYELMGQAFYPGVDDLGPQREAVFGNVLTRLAGAFRGSDCDIKGLFRVVLNTQTYQRQSRLPASPNEHLLFAASHPTRLRADVLWDSLQNVLGNMSAPRPLGPRGPYAGLRGLEGVFREEFKFDPSSKQEDVEGSISQALLLMNSPALNQRIQARNQNLLGRILTAYPRDEDALRMVYLRALARKPSAREQARCLVYVKKVGKRGEAFEDILWALINSTEFQTKR